ncbi:MAG TPA: cytochrome c oxidase assembly protein [Polyangiaceae bacterium]|jgi:putative membrane protein|nr:cytochrome c oxidase assembly protein [Polyangiaceae bacterium]
MNAALDVGLAILAAGYAWCWRKARQGHAPGMSVAHLVAFLVGVGSLWVALASPIAHLDQGHLTGHMLEHLLIMTIAAPLLLLGDPARLWRVAWRREPPEASWRSPHLVVCWLAGTLVVLVWHVPAVFAFGMRWHGLEHATFLIGGLLFWLPVVRPWPFALTFSGWAIPAYLFLATLPCDALSAFLAFCGRVVYPHYDSMHGACCIAPLEDQQRAAALMWFWVTIAYVVPAALVTFRLLSPEQAEQHNAA